MNVKWCIPWTLLSLALWFVALRATAFGQPVDLAGALGSPPRDLVCGPRCVQFLIQYYFKKNLDLTDLVREIQWPDIERGARLDTISESLQKRGLFTCPMRIGSEMRIDWPYPVLVHLGKNLDENGHFVVWLPTSSSGKDEIWFGVDGVRQEIPYDLARKRSGFILLTAPKPILNPKAAIYERNGTRSVALAVFFGVSGFLLTGVLVVRIWPRLFGAPRAADTTVPT